MKASPFDQDFGRDTHEEHVDARLYKHVLKHGLGMV